MTIKGALHSLGFESVGGVRAGKYLEITLDANDRSAAETQLSEMCRRLLANQVIENFRFELEEAPSPTG